jgi:1-deoxy-D-xylulose 5-phosphate reductoisomerase
VDAVCHLTGLECDVLLSGGTSRAKPGQIGPTDSGNAPAASNGANEASVSDYLKGSISFTRIVDPVARVVSEHDTSSTGATTIEDVLAVDA